jgi:uncharacterized protein YjiS (DUF1127 family)
MAITASAKTVPFGAITTFNLINRLDAIRTSVLDWNAKRKTLNVLASMSDRQLEDIGLHRGQLSDLYTRFGR